MSNADFLIARPSATIDLPGYVQFALRPDSEINALVIYDLVLPVRCGQGQKHG
jgi:hypothetical protein